MNFTDKIKQWSDGNLMQMAFWVGQEIDRRWHKGASLEPKTFRDSKDIFVHFHYRLWAKKQEHLYVLLLNYKNQLIDEKLITIGTINASLIHEREVFAPAIEKRASSIILIHNHPSGDAQPSLQDLDITKRLKKVGNLIGIRLLDHLIIGKNQFYSDNLKQIILI